MRFIIFFLINVLTAQAAIAECVYFRVSAKLLRCGAAEASVLSAENVYQKASDIPELELPKPPDLLQVVCSCDYSLQGSDVRCDMDQSLEKTSVLGADEKDSVCRRGNTLCRDVCPARLPS